MRSRSRGIRSPPSWVVWRAHPARSRHWALVGPFHVVRAPPRVLPRSLAPSCALGGGAVRSRFPPTWLWVVGVAVGPPRGGCLLLLRGASGVRRSPSPDCPPTGRAVGVRYPRVVGAGVRLWGPFSVPSACTPCGGCAPRGGSVAFVCRGAGWGGGGVRRTPRLCGRGGPVGRGVALPRSVPLLSLGRQQSGCHWRRSVHGGRGPPYHSGSCSPAFSGRDLCGVLVRWRRLACSPRPLWEPAAGAGGRVALRLLSRAGGGDHPLCLGGWGLGPPRLAGRWGRLGGAGSRRGLPAPLLAGGLRYSILALLVSSVLSFPACACGRGRGAAPGRGGVRGGPWTAPPGAPADLNPPSALPEWAVVTGGSCRARPPYCSGAPPCAAPKLGARVALARWCGLALRPLPPREQMAGGAGARGVQVQPHPPPPPASRSLQGGGGRPLGSGGAEGRSCGPQAWGGERGRGVGGPPPRPPAPSGVGLPSVVSGLPRRAILVLWGLPGGRGRRARSGRPPTGQCGGGGGGKGGETPPLWFASPSSPGRPLIGPFRLRRPGRRRSAVGRQRAGRAGACLGRGAPAPRVQRPLLGGCRAAVSSACLRSLLGLSGRGGGGGGGPLVPWRRLLTAGGGAAWRSRPREPATGWGVALFPRPPLPRAGPSCRPSLGPLIPPAVVARRWPAGGGREG